MLRPALAAKSSRPQSVTCGFLLSESKSSVVPKNDQTGSCRQDPAGSGHQNTSLTRAAKTGVDIDDRHARCQSTSPKRESKTRASRTGVKTRLGDRRVQTGRAPPGLGTGAFKPAECHAALGPARSNPPCTEKAPRTERGALITYTKMRVAARATRRQPRSQPQRSPQRRPRSPRPQPRPPPQRPRER